MKHFYDLAEAHLNQPSIVTIGVFDGVHLGHQHLLKELVREAKVTGRLAAVLTFFPHPDRVLRKIIGRHYLCSPEQRAALLADLGVDIVVTHPFNDQVRQVRAADFIDQLRQHLAMSSLWVTADFAMGYKREGNFTYLSEQSRLKGFELRQIDLLVTGSNQRVSSTMIRESLHEGDVSRAANLLGHAHRVEGPVVHGDHRGHTIGFPTANIDTWTEQILPANGVYACIAWLGAERFLAVANVGKRPTFGGEDIRVEAHLLDFDRDIYGQTLAVEFVARLRGEQKFSGLDALVQQIRADIEHGRSILLAALSESSSQSVGLKPPD